jgi:hypothetical protein
VLGKSAASLLFPPSSTNSHGVECCYWRITHVAETEAFVALGATGNVLVSQILTPCGKLLRLVTRIPDPVCEFDLGEISLSRWQARGLRSRPTCRLTFNSPPLTLYSPALRASAGKSGVGGGECQVSWMQISVSFSCQVRNST